MFDHKKLYGAVPPDGVETAIPSFLPLQLTSLKTVFMLVKSVGSVMLIESINTQLFESVSVTR